MYCEEGWLFRSSRYYVDILLISTNSGVLNLQRADITYNRVSHTEFVFLAHIQCRFRPHLFSNIVSFEAKVTFIIKAKFCIKWKVNFSRGNCRNNWACRKNVWLTTEHPAWTIILLLAFTLEIFPLKAICISTRHMEMVLKWECLNGTLVWKNINTMLSTRIRRSKIIIIFFIPAIFTSNRRDISLANDYLSCNNVTIFVVCDWSED